MRTPLGTAHAVKLTIYFRLHDRAPLANTGGVVHDCFGIAEGGFAVGQFILNAVGFKTL